ncbi:MAG: endonuclease MutS2 [Spirochaetaceae bacterium]|jgi:DNA mismatch repair protein MutS2|nr:endonuclease MutS2 [Spirochaetaceae bacterium]
MNEKTLKLLEFDIIRERVAECARSDEARQRILSETPFTDSISITCIKQNVVSIVDRLISGDVEPQAYMPVIGGLLPILNIAGAVLNIEEAFAIGNFIREGRAVLQWLGNIEISAEIPDCSDVEQEIFRVIDNSGKVRDLPELSNIKKRIAAIKKELQFISASYTNNENMKRMFQSTIPAQRNGRTVIAIKHKFKGRIRGIVHEVSASGQTLFIEPENIVEKNNELIVEQRRFEAELRRILRKMTATIATSRNALFSFHEHIIFIETIRARAHYSNNTKGVFLYQDTVGHSHITLKQARHPLLGDKAVPIDMIMKTRILIISGPNTGGKTVALKTVGLLALMNQFGLALPLAEGSSLPVFNGIFAEIGDDQSLGQSLSTFSAHIKAIASILNTAGETSLILLDELCAGTDPSEGGAIAMAILDDILEKNCFCIVTTHHSALKNYAFSNSFTENASVEFDATTLSPSYRIVMGLPGESRAIDISLHYGLSAQIVEKARNYISQGHGDVSSLIASLKEKHRAVEDSLRAATLEKQRVLEEQSNLDLREKRLIQKEAELKSGSLYDLRRLLDESRKKLENLVRELKEGEITREKTLKVKEFLLKLEKATENETQKLDGMKSELAKQENVATIYSEIQPGVNVLVGDKKLQGQVRRSSKKGFWVVETGSVSMIFNEKELIPVQSPGKPPKSETAIIDYNLPAESVPSELNIRGMRLPEAIDTLQRHIDAALVFGLWEFAVIHGKGDGILQRGVHDYLRSHRFVADYHFSRPELGGFGRTEITLKR